MRRVAVVVSTEEAEPARGRVLELFPGGFEERGTADGLELAVYTDVEGEAVLRTTFASVSAQAVEPGWEDAWREFHRPVHAGGIWVGPPWIAPPPGETVVVVDPGRAFGTGAHATTRACLELLARTERGSLLDAGCGSGVLSVAATRLGFGPVVALDLDPVAVEVARSTAELNGADVQVRVADVLQDAVPPTDVAVANIELRVVESLLPRLPAATAVTSGYLGGEEPRCSGWDVVDRVELDGWAAHALRRAEAH